MLKKIILFCFVGLLSAISPLTVSAQSPNGSNVLTTAVPFLLVSPASRAAGMGELAAATSADVHAPHANPAKLSFVERDYAVSVSFTPWLGKIVNDMSISNLSGFYKISSRQVVGASLTYFHLGSFQFNKGPRPEDYLGSFTPRELSFDVTYARTLSPYLSIGGSMRYIHSNLTGLLQLSQGSSTRPANSFAVDIGLFFTKPFSEGKSNISAGFSITNIGAKMSYVDGSFEDFIPTNLKLGTVYKNYVAINHSIAVGLDINKLLVPGPIEDRRSKNLLQGIFESFSDAEGGFEEEMREFSMSLGFEYAFKEAFFGRFGCFLEAEDKGNRQYFTLGLGAKIKNYGIDLAYLMPIAGQQSPLAETIRITIVARFFKKSRKTTQQEEENTSN